MNKRTLIGVGLVACVVFSGCKRGTKHVEIEENVMEKTTHQDAQHVESGEVLDDALIKRVEALRDREFRRRPTFVAEEVARLAAPKIEPLSNAVQEERQALNADRELVFEGLMGQSRAEGTGIGGALEALARYDAATATVRYASQYADREMLELATVLALVKGLNEEHFGPMGVAKSWDGALAHGAAELGDGLLVAAVILLEASTDTIIGLDELAQFPEIALRHASLRKVLDGKLGLKTAGEDGGQDLVERGVIGFEAREGFALAAALYRAGGWSAVEVMKHGPPESSGYVVRPDRWFSGDDLGTWDWPAELETGWDDERYWYPGVRSGRVGPAMIAGWLGSTIDLAAARTVYAGWRSDAFRMHWGKRIPSARRKGVMVFEWVSQWDTPHSAAQVADAFRLVLNKQQSEREDGAEHVVVQQGLNVAVLVTSSESDAFRPETTRIDRAGVLSGAVVKYGEVQGLPFSFRPTRLEAFLLGARDARLENDVFDDPGSGVRMDLSVLENDWTVQKTDEVSIRWFARSSEGQNGALIQFTTELRDVLGPEFGTEAYREKIEAAFADSMGEGTVDAKDMEVTAGSFAGARVLEIRGHGTIQGTSRGLWVRQFLVGDIVCTLSVQGEFERMDGHIEVARAVFDGISFEQGEERAQNEGDGSIHIEVETDD